MVWRKNSQQNSFRMARNYGFQVLFSSLWLLFILATRGSSSMPKKAANPFFFSLSSQFFFVSPLNIRMHFWPKKFDEPFTKLLFSPVKIKEISSFFSCSLRYFLSTEFFCGFWLQQETNETLKVLIKRLNNNHWANHCTTFWKALKQLIEWNVKKECLRLCLF